MKRFIFTLFTILFLFTIHSSAKAYVTAEEGDQADISLEQLTILFLDASKMPNVEGGRIMTNDTFIISVSVTSEKTPYLQSKVFDVTTGEEIALPHTQDIYNPAPLEFCDNTYQNSVESYEGACTSSRAKIVEFCGHNDLFRNDPSYLAYCNNDGGVNYDKIAAVAGQRSTSCTFRKYEDSNYEVCGGVKNHSVHLAKSYNNYCIKGVVYDGTQDFLCNISTKLASDVSIDSKIKIQFYQEDEFLAETPPIELKYAQDGVMAFESTFSLLFDAILSGINGDEYKPRETRLDTTDSDGDGVFDSDDNFASIPNPDQKPPIALNFTDGNTPAAAATPIAGSGGGNCSLTATAPINTICYLPLIIGLALILIRRHKIKS